jgi:hypothetical protein
VLLLSKVDGFYFGLFRQLYGFVGARCLLTLTPLCLQEVEDEVDALSADFHTTLFAGSGR